MKRIAFSIIIIISFFVSSCIYQPQTANYVKPSIDFSKYKKIAVIRFESQDLSVGQEVADTISISFSRVGYSVIERSQLRAIIDENAFNQSGLTESSKTALRVAGIDALVLGAVTKYDCTSERGAFFYQGIGGSFTTPNCQASLSIKMINVSTGDVLWTAQGSHSLKAGSMTAGKVMQQVIAEIEQSIPPRESTSLAAVSAPKATTTPVSATAFSGNTVTARQTKTDAAAWMEQSTKNAAIKNWSEMIRTASVAITLDPSYAEAYVNRSWAYLEKGFFDEAFADCQKALELDSSNAGAHNNRGLFYLRKGQNDLAKGDFDVACNAGLEVGCSNFKIITGYKPSEKVEFCLKKAEEAFNKRDWIGVIKYTSEIPNNDIALSVRAGAYANQGMFTESIKDCDDAIKMNPNLALAYNNKGYALELVGRKKDALLNYEFACNLKMALGCDNLKRLASPVR